MKTRIGFGFDVHKLVEGRELWLGGIRIEHTLGLLGHSDADVLIHALCDALLGAANMRDIGFHFPDTANEYKNIDSKILLKKTVELIREKGFSIGNADITVCAEHPKLNPHIPLMQKTLSECMGIDLEDISIKATTTEKLGFTGREEGISAYAVVLLENNEEKAVKSTAFSSLFCDFFNQTILRKKGYDPISSPQIQFMVFSQKINRKIPSFVISSKQK